MRPVGHAKREFSMSIGIWQVVLILLIVLILFGAGKLPKVMGDVAKGVKNFKSCMKDDGDEDAEKPAISSDGSTAAQAGVAEPALKRDEAKS
jgi:sec-independent protein translocase protein TatA